MDRRRMCLSFCGSTRRSKSTTTITAASSRTCCGNFWPPHDAGRDLPRRHGLGKLRSPTPDDPDPRRAYPLVRALPLFLLAGLCLSSLDATAKYLVRDNSLFLVLWARYAGQMLIVTPFAWRHAGPGFWRTRRPGLQLLRSALL